MIVFIARATKEAAGFRASVWSQRIEEDTRDAIDRRSWLNDTDGAYVQYGSIRTRDLKQAATLSLHETPEAALTEARLWEPIKTDRKAYMKAYIREYMRGYRKRKAQPESDSKSVACVL